PQAPRAAERPATTPAAPAASAQIVFAKSGRTIACTADDVILEVAEANGIALPNSCRSGTCGTCRVRRLEGTVDLEDQRALSGSDLADGLVLACVGRARGRVVLDA
ncbi:MAG TPA: 2Fe-2S iron-sulfur cluster binding domain-containing protein, partial [Usitatibacter sp.]|nr:2Fe-2S iron-sulfur cluster binding domain-containing protein [Usitatibacter sp.]